MALYHHPPTGLLIVLPAYKTKSIEYTPGTPPQQRCFQTPYIILSILSFSGKVHDVVSFSGINLVCRATVHNERKIWKFCVRYGGVDVSNRAAFWAHISGADFIRQQAMVAEQTIDHYIQAGETGAWKRDIRLHYSYYVVGSHVDVTDISPLAKVPFKSRQGNVKFHYRKLFQF